MSAIRFYDSPWRRLPITLPAAVLLCVSAFVTWGGLMPSVRPARAESEAVVVCSANGPFPTGLIVRPIVSTHGTPAKVNRALAAASFESECLVSAPVANELAGERQQHSVAYVTSADGAEPQVETSARIGIVAVLNSAAGTPLRPRKRAAVARRGLPSLSTTPSAPLRI